MRNFILCKQIFDEVAFIFLREIFAPERAVFFMTSFSDAGGHPDPGINLERPKHFQQSYTRDLAWQ